MKRLIASILAMLFVFAILAYSHGSKSSTDSLKHDSEVISEIKP